MNWLIGASPVCDLVVDEETVSSRHCQIARAGSKLLLRDLDSTNGTWLNGQRITTETGLGRNDTIRLGTRTAVTWQQIEDLINCRVVRIGREPDNDVVLADEKVSGHHARLLVSRDSITLIDLDSSNGTAVGTADNKVSRTDVAQNDQVFFASNRFRVSELVQKEAVGQAPGRLFGRRGVVIAAVTIGVLAGLFAFLRSRGTASEGEARGPQATSGDTDVPAIHLTARQRLEQSLFAVVVKSAESEPGLRVGTAWALTDRKLATSGNLVMFLQQSRADFPVVLIQSVVDGRRWTVSNTHVHENCRQNADRMQQLGERLEQVRGEFAELTEPPDGQEDAVSGQTDADREAIRQLTEQILTLEDEWFLAAENMIHFDAGLLETSESLSRDGRVTTLSVSREQPSRLASVDMSGAAFQHNQSVITEPSKLPVADLACMVEAFVSPDGGGPARLVLSCPVEHAGQNWLGAPVLDKTGRVIGLYSRPTPAPDPETPPPGDRCDVVSVSRLADLLTQSE